MNQFQAPSFSIFDILRGIARRKFLVLFCLGIGILAGMAVLTIYKPTYVAEAQVLIDNQATPYDAVNGNQADALREPPVDDRIVATHVTELQSDDLAMRVIKELGLSGRADFDPMVAGLGTIKKLLIAYGFSDDPALMTPDQRALKELNASVTVFPVPTSNTITVKVTARDGKTAADVANSLTELFVRSTREVKSGTNERARTWLAEQIAALQTKVSASDAAVEKFRSESGLLKGQTSTLGTQEISELNTQIGQAEAASSEAAAKAAEIRNMLKAKGSVESNQDVLNSPTVQSLRGQQISAERKITELSATYLPNHPKMVAARQELSAITSQIRREALKVIDGLQGQANIAAARAASLRKSLEAMKGREGEAAQDDVKLKELEREAKANRDQLEAMMARYADSNTRKNLELQPGYARVIQRASAPAIPYFPKSGPMMLLTSLAGLGLGMGLAFLLEIMAQANRINSGAALEMSVSQPVQRPRHAIHSADAGTFEIPAITPETSAPVRPRSQNGEPTSWPAGTPARFEEPQAETVATPTPAAASTVVPLPLTVATIPMLRSATEARMLLEEMEGEGAASEAIAKLTAQLQDLRQPNKSLACAIASIGAGLEVGTSALAIGRTLARLGVKTMLIDLEAHRPLIPDLLNLPVAPGLSELIGGKADFTKAIQRDEETGLQLIRHGLDASMSELLLGQRMEAVTKTLTGIYDVVLVHVGEASPTTLLLVKGCSAALLCAPGKRQRDAAAAAFTLKASGIRDVNIVNVELPVPAAA